VAADVGSTLVAKVTATNPDGSVSAYSVPTTTVLPAAPRWASLPVLAWDAGRVGDVLNISPGRWSGPAVSTDTVQVMRCTSTCVSAGTANAGHYTITSADVGAILRVMETATNAGGATNVWSAVYVGPVTSPSAGSAVLAAARVVVRSSKGTALALAQASPAGAPSGSRIVSLSAAPQVHGSLRAWVCPVQSTAGGPPKPCTAPVRVHSVARLELPGGMSGPVRVVVVRAPGAGAGHVR
jgi:hypothetical protein